MKFFDLTIEEAGLVVPEAVCDMPKAKGTVVQATMGSLINWVLTQQLFFYPFNRGDGRVSKTTARSAAEGINADIIGECTIGKWEIEEDGKKKNVMCLNNFHSRLYGALKRLKEGTLTRKETNIPVSVRVQEDFLGSYQGMNAAGQAHRTKDKIKSPDLAYGSLLREIFDTVGENCERRLGDNKWTTLSSVLYNLSDAAQTPAKKSNKWYWPWVYRLRTDSRLLADESKGALKVSEERTKDMIHALQYWHSLVMSLEAKVEKGSSDAARIAGSAGFFGYVLCDRVSGKPYLSKNVDVTVKRIAKNIGKVAEICPELTRGNQNTVIRYTGLLDKILKGTKSMNDLDEDEAA